MMLTEKLQHQEFNSITTRNDLEDEKKTNSDFRNTITELNFKEFNSEVEKTKNDLDVTSQMKFDLQVQYDQSIDYQQKMKDDYQNEIDKYNEHNAKLNNQIQKLVTESILVSESEFDKSDAAEQATDEVLDEFYCTDDFLRAQKDMAEQQTNDEVLDELYRSNDYRKTWLKRTTWLKNTNTEWLYFKLKVTKNSWRCFKLISTH